MFRSGPALTWVVRTSLRFRVLVVALAAAVMVLGLTQLPKMPVDALPEFNPPQVEIQTEALGLSAAEVEQLITVPLEADLLNGVAFLSDIRSESVAGLSSIELTFEPGTDLLEARQVVAERLTQAHALPNVSRPPAMLQPRSSTSRVLMVGLSSEQLSLIEMSVLARWKIKPYLLGVPGVANVSVWGQRERQLQVQVDPERLRANGVELSQVIESTGNALWVSPLSFVEASTPGTGGFIDTANQRLGVQHISPITTAQDLAGVTIADTEGQVLHLRDVANVVEDHQPLIGDAVVNDGPSLMLVIEKFPGASTQDVTTSVEDALASLAPGLPDVEVDTTLYRPANFLDSAGDNLGLALLVGLLLFLLLLAAVFRDWRAALVSLVAIPTSVIAALLVLYVRGATFNLMYLAGLAVALALIIDDTVVGVDRIRRGLRERRPDVDGQSTTSIVMHAVGESRSSLLVPTLIVLVAAVPVFMMGGLSGEFSQPMVVSYALAVVASTIVALTVAPALTALLHRDDQPGPDPTGLERWMAARYGAGLMSFIRSPRWAYAAVGGAVVVGLAVVPLMGDRELLPPLQQQQLLIEWDGPPGTSQPEMARITARASAELRSLPGVSGVGGHIGRAITSDEVANVNAAALWVTVDSSADYERTAKAVESVIDGYPGLYHEVETYPAEKIREAQTGSDDDLVVRIYGQDQATLAAKAAEVQQALVGIDGVVDPLVDVEPVEPTLEIEVDLAAAEKHGIKPGDVRRGAAVLLSGIEVGSLFEEQKVFEVVVWGTPEIRNSISNVEDLMVDRPEGGQVRLGDVASVSVSPNPSVISRESVSRIADVSAAVSGRDLGAVRDDVEAALADIKFPLEYHAVVLDESTVQQADERRVISVALVALVAMLLFLQATFRSWRLAVLVLATFPLSLLGGALAALVFGGDLTLPTVAGLLALLGLAIRFDVVLVRRYEELRLEQGGQHSGELVRQVSAERVVPILLTTVGVTALFLPALVMGDVAGLEVVRAAAVVVLGGLVTTALCALFVVPALYFRFAPSGLSSGDDDPEASTIRDADDHDIDLKREGEFHATH